ncbi:Aspartyl/asparaginyl beta-hydroxylase (Aspartate beta-hydroxylase) (ASP beta-hydroxylase) (Peptide-aspartate beta-dioxygenase) [Durusdinium trenchii]|uniref:Aspartyl/asparaginyl beta-hydroxylase (Aspartate beta-hydroxylase) (ASP beta-hydroxylase) (Peptide-aspartate beta-dioxygenase) n=1 Tax=Durusdinium trenchii TaxID=1381693 RepID=A0ABP0H8W2_9DINO
MQLRAPCDVQVDLFYGLYQQFHGGPAAPSFGGVFLEIAAAFDLLSSIGRFFNVASDEAVPSSESSPAPYALFTHEAGQLHCDDRTLRHPCVAELKAFLEDKNHTQKRQNALSCVHEVMETSQDYWELKNMTHLLLDLDTKDHVFDKESRDNDFISAGIGFAKKLMAHPECLNDFDTKGELECRCVPLYGKVSTLKLKNAGKLEEAQELFQQVRDMAWQGRERQYAPGEAVPWDDFHHTPQIWVRGLRSMPVWPRATWKDLPICSLLEEHFPIIQEETARALANEATSGFEDAYRFLYEKGEWNRVLLYHGRKFTEECDRVFPKTCALLRKWLPSKPGLPWTSDQNEQVMVIKMKQGTDVETHSGPANNILNIHLGISGLEGAKLFVANETYSWDQGKVIAWDGSYDHRVHCLDCKETRVIMMVRYMHPDMSPEHYKISHRPSLLRWARWGGVATSHSQPQPAAASGAFGSRWKFHLRLRSIVDVLISREITLAGFMAWERQDEVKRLEEAVEAQKGHGWAGPLCAVEAPEGEELLLVVGGSAPSKRKRSTDFEDLPGDDVPMELWSRPLRGGTQPPWVRSVLAFPPKPRGGASLTTLSSGRLLLFGGRSLGRCLSDVWPGLQVVMRRHILQLEVQKDHRKPDSEADSDSEAEAIFFASDYRAACRSGKHAAAQPKPLQELVRASPGEDEDEDGTEEDSGSEEPERLKAGTQRAMPCSTQDVLALATQVTMTRRGDAEAENRTFPKQGAEAASSRGVDARWRQPQALEEHTPPRPRANHTAVLQVPLVCGETPAVLVYGGLGDGGLPLGDTFQLRILETEDHSLEFVWSCLDTGGKEHCETAPWEQQSAPRPRLCHSAVFWPGSQRSMVIFGGLGMGLEGEPKAQGDCWMYMVGQRNAKAATGATGWKRPTTSGGAPAKRYGHGACLANDAMVICGGMDDTGELADCWLLQFSEMRWEQLESPMPRAPRELGRCELLWSSFTQAALLWSCHGAALLRTTGPAPIPRGERQHEQRERWRSKEPERSLPPVRAGPWKACPPDADAYQSWPQQTPRKVRTREPESINGGSRNPRRSFVRFVPAAGTLDLERKRAADPQEEAENMSGVLDRFTIASRFASQTEYRVCVSVPPTALAAAWAVAAVVRATAVLGVRVTSAVQRLFRDSPELNPLETLGQRRLSADLVSDDGDPHIYTIWGDHYTLLKPGTFVAWNFSKGSVAWQLVACYSGARFTTQGLLLLDRSHRTMELTAEDCAWRDARHGGRPVRESEFLSHGASALEVTQVGKETEDFLSMESMIWLKMQSENGFRKVARSDMEHVGGELGDHLSFFSSKLAVKTKTDDNFQAPGTWVGLGGSEAAAAYLNSKMQATAASLISTTCSEAEEQEAEKICGKHLQKDAWDGNHPEIFGDCVFDICHGAGGEEVAQSAKAFIAA